MSSDNAILTASGSFSVKPDASHFAGPISAEYPCMYLNSNGILYAGSAALYFVGSYFLFEKKLLLPWENVRQVQHEREEHAITILCKDETVFSFMAIQSPERAWLLLVTLHNDAILGRRRPSMIVSPREMLKRRNSDPSLGNMATKLDAADESEEHAEEADGEGISISIPESTAAKSFYTLETGASAIGVAAVGGSVVVPSASTSATPSSANVHEVESITGTFSLQPLSCTHASVNGKLYTGKKALYFYGRKFFFWDRKDVLITWDTVQRIQMVQQQEKAIGDSATIGNSSRGGLVILIKDNVSLEFTDLENADKVWASLVALHNENLTTTGMPPTIVRSPRPRHFPRMNSDPMLASQANFDINVDDDEEEDEATASSSECGATKSAASASRPAELVSDVLTAEEEWKKFISKTNYTNKVIVDKILPCDLNVFYAKFLIDDAEYSTAKFLQSKGDSNLKESRWKAVENGEGHTRVINYTHPVNAPLAPPTANARKEQEFRRYQDHGLCLETKTFVDDVPMADCFFVKDRVQVVSTGPNEVSVTMEFEITFVKSTMFKSIISKTTTSEFIAYFKSLANFMSNALMPKEEDSTAVPVEPSTPWTETKELAPSPSNPLLELLVNPVACLLFLVVLLQIWILVELRGVKQAVRLLKAPSTNGGFVCIGGSVS